MSRVLRIECCVDGDLTDEHRERVRGATLDLLDVLAERGERLGLDDDQRLDTIATAVCADLDPDEQGGPPDVVAVIDAIRRALRRLEMVEPPRAAPTTGPTDLLTRRLLALVRGDGPDDTERVRRAIHDESQRFDGAAVRSFLPILIERRVRRSLGERSATG